MGDKEFSPQSLLAFLSTLTIALRSVDQQARFDGHLRSYHLVIEGMEQAFLENPRLRKLSDSQLRELLQIQDWFRDMQNEADLVVLDPDRSSMN